MSKGQFGRAARKVNYLNDLPGTVQEIIDGLEYRRNIADLANLREGLNLNLNNSWQEQPDDIILGNYNPKDNFVQLPDEPSTISKNKPTFDPESAIAALRRFNMGTLPMRGTDKRLDEQIKATNDLYADDINSRLPKPPAKVNFQSVDPTKDYYDEYGNLMIKGSPKEEKKERKSTLKEIPVKGKPGYKQLARIYDDNEILPLPDTEELIKQPGSGNGRTAQERTTKYKQDIANLKGELVRGTNKIKNSYVFNKDGTVNNNIKNVKYPDYETGKKVKEVDKSEYYGKFDNFLTKYTDEDNDLKGFFEQYRTKVKEKVKNEKKTLQQAIQETTNIFKKTYSEEEAPNELYDTFSSYFEMGTL